MIARLLMVSNAFAMTYNAHSAALYLPHDEMLGAMNVACSCLCAGITFLMAQLVVWRLL